MTQPLVNPTPWIEGRFEENMVLTTVEQAINWARQSSIWPMTFGLACCAIEMMAAGASRYDLDRFGAGAFRATPRQADLMIVAGTVTYKMASRVRRLYNLMPDPKYVIAMGACTITGGMFSADSTTAVRGVDKLIPVDLYLPGCPPRPEAIFDAVIKLRKKVGNEALAERGQVQQEHRYCTIPHQMRPVEPLITGAYLKAESQQRALAAAAGLPFDSTATRSDTSRSEAIPAARSLDA
jgi:NAD(P)H-quinone oxidoreductase subunit K